MRGVPQNLHEFMVGLGAAILTPGTDSAPPETTCLEAAQRWRTRYRPQLIELQTIAHRAIQADAIGAKPTLQLALAQNQGIEVFLMTVHPPYLHETLSAAMEADGRTLLRFLDILFHFNRE